MKRLSGVFAVLACALVLGACSGSRGGGGEIVVGVGYAPVASGDFQVVRQNAIAAAQRDAVEQVVGVFITGSTDVRDAVAVRQKISANTAGFIKTYKVQEEGRDGENYRVRIKALVQLQSVSGVISEVLAANRQGSRVAVFAADSSGGTAAFAQDLRSSAERAFVKKGYSVAGSQAPLAAPADVDSQRAVVEAARVAGASFAVAVSAVSYKLPAADQLGQAFASWRSKVSIKVYAVSSGELVASVSKEASGVDPSDQIASQKAMAAAAELGVPELVKPMDTSLSQGTAIMVVVSGMADLKQLQQFQEMLTAVRAVRNFSLVSYKEGEAALRVIVDSISGQELASSIIRQNPTRYSVTGLDQYQVEIKAE